MNLNIPYMIAGGSAMCLLIILVGLSIGWWLKR